MDLVVNNFVWYGPHENITDSLLHWKSGVWLLVAVANAPSKALEPGCGVAEVIELNPHAVHDGQVHTAELAVVIAFVGVVQDTTGFERAAQASSQEDRHLGRDVFAAGRHAGDKHETRVVEHSACAFRHCIETAREVGKLAAIIAGNPLI